MSFIKFGAIHTAVAQINTYIESLTKKIEHQKTSPALVKIAQQSIKNIEFGLEQIERELEAANVLQQKSNTAQDQIQLHYISALEIAIFLLVHHDDWLNFYDETNKGNRKAGRNTKNLPNDQIYARAVDVISQQLGRDLVGSDYPDWAQHIRDTHQNPPVVQKVRTSKKNEAPINVLVPIDEENQRESPWPESTLRKKFKELTGHKATKKKK